MNVTDYLQALRSQYPQLDPDLLIHVSIENIDETSSVVDERNAFRFAVIDHLKNDFTDEDRPFIRHLMLQEISCEERDIDSCNYEYFETVAQMLFCIGNAEDIPLLWQAKFASFDSTLVIDGAYFFGAGFDET